jgi:hypothetical protein
MKRVLLCYVLCLILLSGCVRPWGVLSHDEMVAVLFDVHLVEAAMKVVDAQAKRIEKQEYYNSVFEKHNITKQQFDKSLNWYSSKPHKLMAIYDDLKVVAEDLQKRVETYEFHPEDLPLHSDSISTFDLWHWERERLLTLGEDSIILIDSLYFSITDSNFFYKTDTLKFYLKMRVYAPDSVSFVTRIVYHYSDSIVDTLQYESLADSVCRRYRFTQNIPSYRDIDSLFIELVDSVKTIESIEIDSVKLERVYNRFLYPLNQDVRKFVREQNDSIREGRDLNSEPRIEKVKQKSKNGVRGLVNGIPRIDNFSNI